MCDFEYPNARKVDDCHEEYHGVTVADYYKWMEDPDADETKAFVEAQNEISLPYLQKFPLRNKFFNSVLYVQESLTNEPRIFLDPNKFSEDGTVSLRGRSFSKDGSLFAYGLSQSGSDWSTIKFKNVETEADLPDELKRVKFSCMSWTHDNKGLFYNCYLEQEGKTDGTETTANVNQKLFYHRLGTPQSEDVLFAEFPDNPKWMSGAQLSDDGNYVVLTISQDCDPVNRLWYIDLRTLKDGICKIPDWVKLVDNFDAEYEYITNEGTLFTFKTNLKAPRYKLINIDFEKPDMENWSELVQEHPKDVLEWTACVNQDKLVVAYLRDVKSALELRKLSDGSLMRNFPLDVGSVLGYSGRKEQNEMFYLFASFLSPGIIYRYDFSLPDPQPIVFRQIEVKGFDSTLFETTQVFYSSKDGTKIPMFIVHKKNLPLTGNHPTLLYAYGGFNISITPSFSVARVIFMLHMGGVCAIANIRGGGEYGETWHKQGMLLNKQNCFDDFQCAAKYLVEQGYTSHKKVAIQGGSNGGLLVGACINQRPELFGCAIAQVGVMDMLKFHKYTIGHAWTSDFGCSDNEKDFHYLYKYSPLHNVGKSESGAQYPALLLLTGDHDDRVVPHHSLKYIATVQEVIGSRSNQKNPLLIRVDTKSGHGSGKPTAKVIEEASDIYGFIGRSVGAEWSE